MQMEQLFKHYTYRKGAIWSYAMQEIGDIGETLRRFVIAEA